MKNLKILLVHGVGHKEASGAWDTEWQEAIQKSVGTIDNNVTIEFDKLHYDELFAKSDLDTAVIAEAMARLIASGVWV